MYSYKKYNNEERVEIYNSKVTIKIIITLNL